MRTRQSRMCVRGQPRARDGDRAQQPFEVGPHPGGHVDARGIEGPLQLDAVHDDGDLLGERLYLSVDTALAAAVLPNPDESAKDMGVLNIGNALPQSLVPIAAPALLATGGGRNYGALFLFGAIAAVLGALAVRFIRSVR
ncbi:hypothetical protein ACWEQ3_02390 [Streptomyces mirabilis]